jgi:hypothetical protein
MFHARMLMCSVVVDDQVQVHSAGRLVVDPIHEAEEFLLPVFRHAIPDDRTVQRREGCEQRRYAVPLVVSRVSSSRSGPVSSATRLGSVQGLDLALFVRTQHQRLVGRIQIKPHHLRELFHEVGIAAHFECQDVVRLFGSCGTW